MDEWEVSEMLITMVPANEDDQTHLPFSDDLDFTRSGINLWHMRKPRSGEGQEGEDGAWLTLSGDDLQECMQVNEEDEVTLDACRPESLEGQWWQWFDPEDSNNDKTLEQHLWRLKNKATGTCLKVHVGRRKALSMEECDSASFFKLDK
jgi:hypothetical protein